MIFFCAGSYLPTYDYVTEMPQPEEVTGVYYYSDAYRVETGGSDVEGGGQLILFPDGRLETRGGTLRICSQTLRIDSVIIPEPDAHGTWKLEDSQSVSITLKYELEEDSPDDFAEFWLVYDNDGEIAFLPNVDPSGLFPLLQRREPVPEHE
ncbi:MAG: hypothetical protein H6824_05305 [Planctomycetaceae bacterium]|nr:hypothetical protein [Planctomycetaceae bacterium]